MSCHIVLIYDPFRILDFVFSINHMFFCVGSHPTLNAGGSILIAEEKQRQYDTYEKDIISQCMPGR